MGHFMTTWLYADMERVEREVVSEESGESEDSDEIGVSGVSEESG